MPRAALTTEPVSAAREISRSCKVCDQDVGIQAAREVLQVIEIVLQAAQGVFGLVRRHVDLGPAGNPRLHPVALAVERDRARSKPPRTPAFRPAGRRNTSRRAARSTECGRASKPPAPAQTVARRSVRSTRAGAAEGGKERNGLARPVRRTSFRLRERTARGELQKDGGQQQQRRRRTSGPSASKPVDSV